MVYIARDPVGEIKVDQTKHTEWKYFDVSELPEQLSPPIKPILECFIQGQSWKVKYRDVGLEASARFFDDQGGRLRYYPQVRLVFS